MKKTAKFFALIAAMPLACFCTKTEEPSSNVVTISAEIPETKVSLTAGDDPALALAWEETDKITVEGKTTSEFSIAEIKNSHSATFTGDEVTGTSFNVYYPSADVVSRSYEGQVQDGNGSTAHLEFNAMAEGLDSYEKVTFTKVNGAIKIVVKVPEEVTAVSSLSITSLSSADTETEQSVFYKTNDEYGEKTSTLTLGFTDGTAPVGNVLTAYMMVSWNPVKLTEDDKLAIKLTVPGKACTYTKTIKLNSDVTIEGGYTMILDLSDAKALKHVLAGSGTETDPYQLYDVVDLKAMNDMLVAKEIKYFKLMADVDMTDVKDWTPANQASPYDMGINFDGDGHTISNFKFTTSGKYAGFIGVLYGTVKNVTFDSATISATKAAGVVCGYAGTGSYPATIENVVVKGDTQVTQYGTAHSGLVFGISAVTGCSFTDIKASGTVKLDDTATISNTNAATGGIGGASKASTYIRCSFDGIIKTCRNCGGIVGYEQTAGSTFSQCWTNVTINSSRINSASGENVGGIVGYLAGGVISNCYTKGTITIPDQICGGIVGEVKAESTISNCWSSVDLTAARCAGGIVGRACNAGWNSSSAKCLTLSSCVYWGSKIDVTSATSSNGSSGAIVGYTTLSNELRMCYRSSSLEFVNTNNTENTPADQPDLDGTNWVKGTTPQVGTGSDPTKYLFPYWGKAASETSVSAVVSAQGLPWDSGFWDLTSDYPTLKNNAE